MNIILALSDLLLRSKLKLYPPEVDGFYWTVLVPDIVNSGREEQGSVLA